MTEDSLLRRIDQPVGEKNDVFSASKEMRCRPVADTILLIGGNPLIVLFWGTNDTARGPLEQIKDNCAKLEKK